LAQIEDAQKVELLRQVRKHLAGLGQIVLLGSISSIGIGRKNK
jgi:hypothetical protein